MRLSSPLSAAIGVSGRAAAATSSASSLISTPPSLTRSSCLSVSGHGEEGAGAELGDERGEGQSAGILFAALGVGPGGGVHELHSPGLIAKDDELHLLLVADGLDPSGHRDGAVGETLKLADENAFTHDRPVYVGATGGLVAVRCP